MARKPNYDFERKERERIKNEKKAARAEAKAKPTDGEDASKDDGSGETEKQS